MKSAHLLPGGNSAAFDLLIAALSRDGQETLPLTAAGPDWLLRPRLAMALSRFAPRILAAWSPQAARVAPAGGRVLLGRPGGDPDLAPYVGCDHLIAATPAELRWIKSQTWTAAHVHMLPAVVPDFAGVPRATHPAPPGVATVLAIGRLQKSAGLDVLLAAMSRLPEIHALIAGDGPERAALIALARQAGIASRVHFLGARRDSASLLASCTLVVSAARQDTEGEAILQAFSAGKPVVASMAEAALDLLSGGTSGILVPGDSGIALAAGIEGVLANQAMATAMAAAGRRQFETTFAGGAVAAAWRGICERVVAP